MLCSEQVLGRNATALFVPGRQEAAKKVRRGKSEEKCNCCRGQQAAGCPSVDAEAKNMLISLLLFLHDHWINFFLYIISQGRYMVDDGQRQMRSIGKTLFLGEVL